MVHDARAIANFILDHTSKRGVAVSNMALNKLIYFCHATFIAEFGRPLVQQQFEAWDHGPVLQDIYHQFKNYKDAPILTRAKRLDTSTASYVEVGYNVDAVDSGFLVKIIDFYSRFSAAQLRDISHEVGGPWYEAWHHQGTSNPGMVISNERISDYFRRKVREARSLEH